MTDINWSDYIESPEDIEERVVKDEGDFVRVAIGEVDSEAWYKVFVGLRTGHILRHDDGIELRQDRLDKDDLVRLLEEVGRYTDTTIDY